MAFIKVVVVKIHALSHKNSWVFWIQNMKNISNCHYCIDLYNYLIWLARKILLKWLTLKYASYIMCTLNSYVIVYKRLK